MKRFRLLLGVLLISIVATLTLPVYTTRYIHPAFDGLLTRLTEEEAVRLATHLAASLSPGDDPFRKESFLPRFGERIETFRRDINLVKIKMFSRDGEIIYSTDRSEIGEINRKSYFHEIVAQGTPYTKVVRKEAKTLEDKVMLTDVVETYVPIVMDGRFAGAFEVYYDISKSQERLDNLIRRSTNAVFAVTFLLLVAVILSSAGAYRSIRDRNRIEKTLRDLAETDPLTKTFNRRSLFRFLEAEVDRALRYERPFSLILFDLDHFKAVNDTHGHETGDSVLVSFADLTRKKIRGSDIFCRYGGEEFLVIAPETDLSGACVLAERVRKGIEENPHHKAGQVTVSAGAGMFREGEDGTSLLRRVDKALYAAKDKGRNRVEIAG